VETATGSDGKAGLFLGFFYALRARGLKVTPNQWMTLVEGLIKGLHGSSLMGFYSLARAILAKDESELDDFDIVFSEHFEGVDELVGPRIEKDIWEWLENPIASPEIDPSLRKVMDEVDVDELRRQFEERLKEQTERHDGGGRWIGTGGTSPFGHGGNHPGGFRIGGERRNGSAVQVAADRRYREHRRDLQLDTRQLSVALKKLRALERIGNAQELDVEETIDKTAREAGELQLVFQAPRANSLGILLAMDVGGSMEPFRHLVNLLFSAAHGARHFKRFEHVYFHNCIYERVYADAAFTEPVDVRDLMREFDRETRLVIVGDAYMYPGELTHRWGAINWGDHNEEPGIAHLARLADHFGHSAWLNPFSEGRWAAPSIRLVRQVFEMYPLTVSGVERLAEDLGE